MPDRHFDDSYDANPAECYERFFVPAIGEPLAADLVRRAALRPGERVLDVACGTGVVARLAAREVGEDGSVAGLDMNPAMLAVARSRGGPDIEWHEGSAEALPLPDAAFDVVLCQLSLQFVQDKDAALRAMHRVLAPDGRMLLSVPGPTAPLFEVLVQAMERNVGAPAAGFVSQVFSLHDTDEIGELVRGAGFRDVTVEADTGELRLPPAKSFLWEYVRSTPLAGMVADAGQDALEALERQVLEGWREFEDDGGLAYRQRLVVACARR